MECFLVRTSEIATPEIPEIIGTAEAAPPNSVLQNIINTKEIALNLRPAAPADALARQQWQPALAPDALDGGQRACHEWR